jgi:hypothetical protein
MTTRQIITSPEWGNKTLSRLKKLTLTVKYINPKGSYVILLLQYTNRGDIDDECISKTDRCHKQMP